MTTQQPNRPSLTLYRGWPDQNQYVWSPFVTKLELRLRLSNCPYKTACGSPTTASKGKIPYISLSPANGEPPTLIGDSTLIVDYLVGTNQLQSLYSASSPPAAKSHDVALRAMMEDRLYFYHTRERWLENYYIQRDKALWTVPYPVRVVVGLLVHRKVSGMLQVQGTGRYSDDEIRVFKGEIWETVNALLEESLRRSKGEKDEPFWCLGGLTPTEADCVVYVLIAL